MKVYIFDIETMQELFLIGLFDPETKEYKEFEITGVFVAKFS